MNISLFLLCAAEIPNQFYFFVYQLPKFLTGLDKSAKAILLCAAELPKFLTGLDKSA